MTIEKVFEQQQPYIQGCIEVLATDQDPLGYIGHAAIACNLIAKAGDEAEASLYQVLAEASTLLHNDELFWACWDRIPDPMVKWRLRTNIAEVNGQDRATERQDRQLWAETRSGSKQEDADPAMLPEAFVYDLRLELLQSQSSDSAKRKTESAILAFQSAISFAPEGSIPIERIDSLRYEAGQALLDYNRAKEAREMAQTIESDALREQLVTACNQHSYWRNTSDRVLGYLGLKRPYDYVAGVESVSDQNVAGEIDDVPPPDQHVDLDSVILISSDWQAQVKNILDSGDHERARQLYFRGLFLRNHTFTSEDVDLALYFAAHDGEPICDTLTDPDQLCLLPYGEKRMLAALQFARSSEVIDTIIHEELITWLTMLWRMHQANAKQLDAGHLAQFAQYGVTLSEVRARRATATRLAVAAEVSVSNPLAIA